MTHACFLPAEFPVWGWVPGSVLAKALHAVLIVARVESQGSHTAEEYKTQRVEMTGQMALCLPTVSPQPYKWQNDVKIAFLKCCLPLSKQLSLFRLFLK